MRELTKQDQLDLEAYRTLNRCSVQTGVVALSMARWSAILAFGTAFFVWKKPYPPVGVQIGVLVGSLVIMCVLHYFLRKQDFLADTQFRLMRNIEDKLHFRVHKDLYDVVREQGSVGRQRKWLRILNKLFIGVLFFNLICVVVIRIICTDVIK